MHITKGSVTDNLIPPYLTINEQVMKRLVVVVVVVVLLLLLSSSWNIVDENYPCPKWQVSKEWIDDDALLIP